MPEENTIQISPEVHASNHAALAAFFENRALVASQRYMDTVMELKRVTAENAELRASIPDAEQPQPEGGEIESAVASLKRVNIENEELRASLALMSKPRPQDQEDSALAYLLRTFIAAEVFTKAAAETLVRDAKQIIPLAEVATGADTTEGGAS